jgi:hypothetical protein
VYNAETVCAHLREECGRSLLKTGDTHGIYASYNLSFIEGSITRNDGIRAPENKEEADHFKYSWLTSVVILLVTKQGGAVPFASKMQGS